MTEYTRQGQLYIIAAPSGGGKTSLVTALLKIMPNIQVSISHTTRPMRPNEQQGVNYFFIDETTFADMQKRGDFLETAVVFKNHYGTSKQWVIDTLAKGVDVILEIDWQGAQSVRELFADTISIFIFPPSIEVLAERLKARQTDSSEVIQRRLDEAALEMSHYNEFDYIVVNDNFDEALTGLVSIIRAARLRTRNRVPPFSPF